MKKVKEIMSKVLITAQEDQPVKELRRLMSYNHIGAIPIVSKTNPFKPVGIVTDTDIRNVQDANMPASAVMSTVLQSVQPNTTIAAAAKIMLQYGIHHLLVREHDEIVGLLSTMDLLTLLAEEGKVNFASRMVFV